jgi:uncharacterized protein
MEDTLLQFIRHLRHHGVSVSTAETLDAMQVAATLGYSDKALLYHGLSSCLAKTEEERDQYQLCFQRFFEFSDANKATTSNDPAGEHPPGAENAEPPPSGDGQGSGSGAGMGGADSPADAQTDSNQDQLRAEVIRAAAEVGLDKLRYSTQRGVYRRRMLDALGDGTRQAEIRRLAEGDDAEQARGQWLSRQRELQISMVKEMIDRQLLLNNNAENREIQEQLMRDSAISALDQYYLKKLPQLIRKLAKKLASRHRQRLHRAKRGKPDLGKTLRRNLAYGGIPFHRFWRQKKREKSEIFILCDLSGSVSTWSRVLMLFVQSLADVLPNTRSFVFCGKSYEVSDYFKNYSDEEALAKIQQQYGMGGSDYGLALTSFRDQIIDRVNRRSCIIILGDGRGNGGNTGIDALRELYQRARILLWFNPEPQSRWNTGDSEIRRYQSAAHYVAECGSLRKLEHLLDDLLNLLR